MRSTTTWTHEKQYLGSQRILEQVWMVTTLAQLHQRVTKRHRDLMLLHLQA
eukprot:m.247733 g.247733  ORF g.247733 m.247733 type:complete len:51 (+) comp15399_c1_seq1:1945-2097(+)